MFKACIVVLQGLRVSEFVMSNELVSMTLAMVSESREVNTILKELFTPEGNELYVHPASRYLRCLDHAAYCQSRLGMLHVNVVGPVVRCVHMANETLHCLTSCRSPCPLPQSPIRHRRPKNTLGCTELIKSQGGRGPELF